MTPNMIQLPENVHVCVPERDQNVIDGVCTRNLYIINGKITSDPTLFEWMLRLTEGDMEISDNGVYAPINPTGISKNDWDSTVKEIESQGITYEAFIEKCVSELDCYERIFERIPAYFGIEKIIYKYGTFSSGEVARGLAQYIIDVMRNCGDWDELYNMINKDSIFRWEIKKQIVLEMAVRGLILFPENKVITVNGKEDIWKLEIRNHIAVPSLFQNLLHASNLGILKEAVSKIRACRISCESIIKYCVGDLRRYEFGVSTLYRWYGYFEDSLADSEKFARSKKGLALTKEITGRIEQCSNWEEFSELLSEKSQFSSYMKVTVGRVIQEYSATRTET